MLRPQANIRPPFHDDIVPFPAWLGALPPCRLMVVDDDETMRIYLSSILRKADYEVDAVDCGSDALRLLRAGYYDILLTDCEMPGMDGLTLCERVRAEFAGTSPYILMFTVKDNHKDRYAGLLSGADEYIIKGTPRSEMLAKLDVGRRIWLSGHALARCDAPKRTMGLVDPLTNAHNARYFARKMAKEIQRAQHRQRALSVLSCRMEGLEELASGHGRAAADEALRAFADCAGHCLRPGQDWFARIAPDRFVLVLPGTQFKKAQRTARKLVQRFDPVPLFRTAGSIQCSLEIDITGCEPWLDWTPLSDLTGYARTHPAGPH
jgi:diguanylate cyclase (GGDEF)-like protein